MYVVHGLSFIDYHLSLLVSIVYHLGIKRDVELRARQEHGRIVPCLRFRVQDSGFRVQGTCLLRINYDLLSVVYCALFRVEVRGDVELRTAGSYLTIVHHYLSFSIYCSLSVIHRLVSIVVEYLSSRV